MKWLGYMTNNNIQLRKLHLKETVQISKVPTSTKHQSTITISSMVSRKRISTQEITPVLSRARILIKTVLQIGQVLYVCIKVKVKGCKNQMVRSATFKFVTYNQLKENTPNPWHQKVITDLAFHSSQLNQFLTRHLCGGVLDVALWLRIESVHWCTSQGHCKDEHRPNALQLTASNEHMNEFSKQHMVWH